MSGQGKQTERKDGETGGRNPICPRDASDQTTRDNDGTPYCLKHEEHFEEPAPLPVAWKPSCECYADGDGGQSQPVAAPRVVAECFFLGCRLKTDHAHTKSGITHFGTGPTPCKRCRGTGEIVPRDAHKWPKRYEDCPDCNGTGRADVRPVAQMEGEGKHGD